MVTEKYLAPDLDILSSIFPKVADINLDNWRIISNTFETCTFSIHLEAETLPGYPQDLLVRLQTSEHCLATVAALQYLGHCQLSDIVPPPLDVGTATTVDGTQLQYSVTTFYTGTKTLEEIWDTLDHRSQQKLMQSVVRAVEKLQKLDLRTDVAKRILTTTAHGSKYDKLDSPFPVGGPPFGYFQNIKQLLPAILHAGNPKLTNCSLSESREGIAIQSTFNDIGRVEFAQSDFDALWESVVFCHNDLEPRNLLVRQTPSTGTGTIESYELVAIIDWEMAGFYPFAYEYGLKDTILGTSNLSFSWYALFKEQTAYLLPQEECHAKLIKALRIVDESRKRSRKRNVGVRFQSKWVAREGIWMSPDERRGWVRKNCLEDVRPFTLVDKANLELEVLKELGYS